MAVYTYAKYVEPTVLAKEIAKAGYQSYIDSIHLDGKLLTIETKFVLTPKEEILFRKLVMSHIPVDPAVAAVQIKVDDAIVFGRSILTEYAAMNALAKVPSAVVAQIIVSLLPIQASLQSGSLYTALDLMSKIPPSPYLKKTTLDYFIAKIKRYLDIP